MSVEREGSLYEKVLARLVGVERAAPPAPRASASVVLWRRDAAGELEVFWLRRAAGMAFMGGWHAFPGGGLSRGDRALAVRGSAQGVGDGPADAAIPEAVLGDLSLGPVLPPGMLACALRELFEETGVLPLADGGDRGDEAARSLGHLRRRHLEVKEPLAEILGERGLEPDAGALVYAGRWLTPPLGPLRFDNRFFLLEWPPDRAVQPAVHGGEADHGEWIRPAAGIEGWRRGDIITAPPILHILRVLAEEGPERGLARLRNPEEANWGPYRKVEFRPGVVLLPQPTPTLPPADHTHAYLLGYGQAVLVDPGSPYERDNERLEAALRVAAERDGRRVTAIWLTHHHPDHVGGVERLRRALGVPVRAHPLTAERLGGRGIPVDGPLEEGRVVLDGDPPMPIQVLHTPGHARGHLCFYDETWGSLVAGDVVAGLGTIVIDPPEGDMEVYLETLARLRELAPRTIFPSHGPVLLDGASCFARYLDHRLWRERRILEAWRSGLRQPSEMLPTVYDDVPEVAHPLAERQILAHLARLRVRGEIGETDG